MFSKPTGTSECETKHGVPPRERRRGSESDPSAAAGLGPARGLSTRGSRGWGGAARRGRYPGLRCLGSSLLFRAQASESKGLGRNPTSVIVEESSSVNGK